VVLTKDMNMFKKMAENAHTVPHLIQKRMVKGRE
jgi:hypothetical protein